MNFCVDRKNDLFTTSRTTTGLSNPEWHLLVLWLAQRHRRSFVGSRMIGWIFSSSAIAQVVLITNKRSSDRNEVRVCAARLTGLPHRACCGLYMKQASPPQWTRLLFNREETYRGQPAASAAIRLAFSLASSSVPTYMKALSGRSSPSPARSRSNESMVSVSGVVTPGKPVNCSAT